MYPPHGFCCRDDGVHGMCRVEKIDVFFSWFRSRDMLSLSTHSQTTSPSIPSPLHIPSSFRLLFFLFQYPCINPPLSLKSYTSLSKRGVAFLHSCTMKYRSKLPIASPSPKYPWKSLNMYKSSLTTSSSSPSGKTAESGRNTPCRPRGTSARRRRAKSPASQRPRYSDYARSRTHIRLGRVRTGLLVS
jgi:hypothetical protein